MALAVAVVACGPGHVAVSTLTTLPHPQLVVPAACSAVTREEASAAMGVPLPSNNPGVPNDRDGCEYDAAGDPSMFAAVDRIDPALRAQSPADLAAGQLPGAGRLRGLPNWAFGYLWCGVMPDQHSCHADVLLGKDEFVVTVGGARLPITRLRQAALRLTLDLCRSAHRA